MEAAGPQGPGDHNPASPKGCYEEDRGWGLGTMFNQNWSDPQAMLEMSAINLEVLSFSISTPKKMKKLLLTESGMESEDEGHMDEELVQIKKEQESETFMGRMSEVGGTSKSLHSVTIPRPAAENLGKTLHRLIRNALQIFNFLHMTGNGTPRGVDSRMEASSDTNPSQVG
ncbi:hypothetical protein R1sor_010430 [Riccia sorocarpa]|uniref:Uncharacterized protein n=1 Tax=Riccia sorocarpa TaxID=122646 RepID=A0ABD3HZY5_9MARC